MADDGNVIINEDQPATLLNPVPPTDPNYPATALTVTIDVIPDPATGATTYTPSGGSVQPLTPGAVLSVAELATVSFEPVANYDGPVISLAYTVTNPDGFDDTAIVTIALVPVNDPPEASDDNVNVQEDTPTALNPTLPSDIEDPTAALMITIDQVPGPVQGVMTYIPDAGGPAVTFGVGVVMTTSELASVSFTPEPNYNGPVSGLVYTVTDTDGGTDQGSVSIMMVAVNDDPVAIPENISVAEDNVAAGTIATADVDNDPLTVTLLTPASNGTAVVNSDGTYTYTPNPDWHGTDTFDVVVEDGRVEASHSNNRPCV